MPQRQAPSSAVQAWNRKDQGHGRLVSVLVAAAVINTLTAESLSIAAPGRCPLPRGNGKHCLKCYTFHAALTPEPD
jgi:hypothetical protein